MNGGQDHHGLYGRLQHERQRPNKPIEKAHTKQTDNGGRRIHNKWYRYYLPKENIWHTQRIGSMKMKLHWENLTVLWRIRKGIIGKYLTNEANEKLGSN